MRHHTTCTLAHARNFLSVLSYVVGKSAVVLPAQSRRVRCHEGPVHERPDLPSAGIVPQHLVHPVHPTPHHRSTLPRLHHHAPILPYLRRKRLQNEAPGVVSLPSPRRTWAGARGLLPRYPTACRPSVTPAPP